MKKCEYCAKEISYNEIHCSKKCEDTAKKYYAVRVKLQILMNVLNIAGTIAIAVGIFVFPLHNISGAFLLTFGGLSTGCVTLLLPTPTENILSKYKIKKATFLVRIFGGVLLAFGIAALIFALILI